MPSQQEPYNYSGPDPFCYQSGSGPPLDHPSHSQEQSWPPAATSSSQAGYPQSYQSVDPAGSILEISDEEARQGHGFIDATVYPPHLQDVNYALNQRSYGTVSTNPAQYYSVGTYATQTNDGVSYPYHPYSHVGYAHQQQYGHTAYQPVYDYSQQSLVQGASTSQMTNQFIVQTPQTYQNPSIPVYSYPSPAQHYAQAMGRGGAVYRTGMAHTRPATERLIVDGANMPHSANLELPTSDVVGGRSHTSPVASSSNQALATSPGHSLSRSPERKRLLSFSVDEESSAVRRVVPRYERADSTVSDSHRQRSRSSSVIHGRGPLIPQERYTTSSITAPEQHPSIPFNLEDPREIGIPIIDILNRTDSFARLQDRTQAFSHMGKKTFTLRVLWPGYKHWSKTIAAMDWTKTRAPITRVKLAEALAVAIRDLFERYRDEGYDSDYAEWNIGPNGIQLDQICLVALHQVSRGSWQPQLCLLSPRR